VAPSAFTVTEYRDVIRRASDGLFLAVLGVTQAQSQAPQRFFQIGVFEDASTAAAARDCVALGLISNPPLNKDISSYSLSQVADAIIKARQYAVANMAVLTNAAVAACVDMALSNKEL
ncbi:hypothetical protein HaLaN_25745, partial [Haematococcus lacustris]